MHQFSRTINPRKINVLTNFENIQLESIIVVQRLLFSTFLNNITKISNSDFFFMGYNVPFSVQVFVCSSNSFRKIDLRHFHQNIKRSQDLHVIAQD